MTSQPLANRSLLTGTLLLALAVIIGAFGAHGLKELVSPEKLVTFETGVRYHFYHGIGLVLLGLLEIQLREKITVPYYAFLGGILLFSFNCYLYVLLNMKIFAMIVPVGGLLFVLGWMGFFVTVWKLRSN